jgi:tripartite-type tricarboxylate transporter receptor subunit TctC
MPPMPATTRSRNRASQKVLVISALVLSALAGAAKAQEGYPSRPLRIVVGFSPGGGPDITARHIAQKLGDTLKQPVIVENRPGAGGSLAAGFVAKQAPDGYTVWLQDMTSHAINQSLYSSLPYHPINDFTPVTLVAYSPLMLAVHPSQPTATVKELIEYLKSNKDRRMYASAGNGTPNHLAAELLKNLAGLSDVVHVPYKGSAPTVVSLLSNEVAFSFLSMPPAVANVASGKLRGLAVTSSSRVSAAPNVPTMMEAGIPNFEIVVYTGILGPAGLPASIVAKLNAEFTKAVNAEQTKAIYSKIGAEGITNTPEAFRAMMEKDIAKFAPLVKASGARID